MTTPTHPTIDAFMAAAVAGDAGALAPLLSDDVVFISPITDAFRFRGRDAVRDVYASAFALLSGIEVHTVLGSEDTWAYFIRGQVAGQAFEECQLLRLDAAGLVREITMMGRPVPAVLAVMGRIGTQMHRNGLMTRSAALAGAGVRPVAGMLRLVERHVLPRMPPRGSR